MEINSTALNPDVLYKFSKGTLISYLVGGVRMPNGHLMRSAMPERTLWSWTKQDLVNSLRGILEGW